MHVPLDSEAGEAGQQGMQSDGAQKAPSDTVDQPLEVVIGNPDFNKAADAQRVVWARVKGFPHWPVSWTFMEQSYR